MSRESEVKIHYSEYILSMKDGFSLVLSAGDDNAGQAVEFLARVAKLESCYPPHPKNTTRLYAVSNCGTASDAVRSIAEVDINLEVPDRRQPYRRKFNQKGEIVLEPIELTPYTEEQRLWLRLSRLSAEIGGLAQSRGGVLLHSALAVRRPFPIQSSSIDKKDLQEGAVLLAGRSGVGKSTASLRLAPPWQSVCDDMCLVVNAEPNIQGNPFWVHPWPTWSRFFGSEKKDDGCQWDVQRAVPLRAIFFLEQADMDDVCPIGPGEAVCRLTPLAHDTTIYLMQGWSAEQIIKFNTQRFNNLCQLVKILPAYRLKIKLHGKFWLKMDEVLFPA